MSAFSDYAEQKVLNATLRGQPLTAPTAVYLALFDGDPTDTGSGALEIADSGYVRQDMAKGDAIDSGWTAPAVSGSGHAVKNALSIQFPAIVDGPVSISHFALFDSSGGGNFWYVGAFSSVTELNVNEVFAIAAESIQITLR